MTDPTQPPTPPIADVHPLRQLKRPRAVQGVRGSAAAPPKVNLENWTHVGPLDKLRPNVARRVLLPSGEAVAVVRLADDRVVAVARQVKPGQSRLRPIGTGDTYQPPPPAAGEPASADTSFAAWQRHLLLLPLPLERGLRDAFQGISPALARQLAPEAWLEQPVQSLSETQWQQLWQAWQGWLEALEKERFHWQPTATGYRCWAPTAPSPDGSASLAINRALAGYYAGQLAERQLRDTRQQLRHQLGKLAEQQERQASDQEALLAAAAGRGRYAAQNEAERAVAAAAPSLSAPP